jgi:hypothetical protein
MRVVERIVYLSRNPQPMQEHRELSRHGHHRPFFEFWVPYEELGEDHFDRRRSGEAYAERLVRQLERLGHKVALEPLPQSA